jgi:hypothetical protein
MPQVLPSNLCPLFIAINFVVFPTNPINAEKYKAPSRGALACRIVAGNFV